MSGKKKAFIAVILFLLLVPIPPLWFPPLFTFFEYLNNFLPENF